jgi:RNA polymerase sigma factor (sigma-70 family)
MVRRYRAERLLKKDFEALKARVVATVRARLRASGVTLAESDLEACYAVAWQGLYAAMLEGQEIENPTGWLVLVSYRRAIEEHRSGERHRQLSERIYANFASSASTVWEHAEPSAPERDIAAELDDRTQLRHLFEGLRGRLSAREREAAVLCYLQGLSRAQAAEHMGVSERRMRKLMEGGGAGRPGVAGKVGALVEAIRDGEWCEEQGSLMRAYAFGVLAPDGERHQLAQMHHGQCPACRAYVLSLRGLAVTLPPVFLPWGLGAAVLAAEGGRVGLAASAKGAAVSGARGSTSSLPASGAAAGAGAGAGAGSAAGGGWLFAGGAKLAAGCVLALTVGAGCAALDIGVHEHHRPARTHRAARTLASPASTDAALNSAQAAIEAIGRSATQEAEKREPVAPAARAAREFGPEQALATNSLSGAEGGASHAGVAHAAAAEPEAESTQATGALGQSSRTGQTSAGGGSSGGSAGAAEREFSPG